MVAHWLAVEGVQPAIPENPAASLTAAVPAPDPAVPEAGVVKAAKDSQVPDKASVKPLVKHILSRELQVYYKKITSDILRDSEAATKHALDSAAQDPGLHQLVPYFAQFIQEKVRVNSAGMSLMCCRSQQV